MAVLRTTLAAAFASRELVDASTAVQPQQPSIGKSVGNCTPPIGKS